MLQKNRVSRYQLTREQKVILLNALRAGVLDTEKLPTYFFPRQQLTKEQQSKLNEWLDEAKAIVKEKHSK